MPKPDEATRVRHKNTSFLWMSKVVFYQQWRQLSDKAARVYVTLCYYADGTHSEEGMGIAIDTLAFHNGTTERSIQRALKELKEGGLIEVEPTFDVDGGQGMNRYLLLD